MKNRPNIRLYTPKNQEIFHDMLKSIDWKLIFGNCDTNGCYNKFIEQLTVAYNESFPLTKISRRAFKDKKWFTNSLKQSCKYKNHLYKQWVHSKTDYGHKNYVAYKKVYQKELKIIEEAIISKITPEIFSIW